MGGRTGVWAGGRADGRANGRVGGRAGAVRNQGSALSLSTAVVQESSFSADRRRVTEPSCRLRATGRSTGCDVDDSENPCGWLDGCLHGWLLTGLRLTG